MSIQSEINRINSAKADILAALTEKGVDTTGAGLSDIAALVAAIEAGGGKVSSGTIIPASGVHPVTFQHGLGVIPNLFIVMNKEERDDAGEVGLRHMFLYCKNIADPMTYIGACKAKLTSSATVCSMQYSTNADKAITETFKSPDSYKFYMVGEANENTVKIDPAYSNQYRLTAGIEFVWHIARLEL